MSLVGPMYQTSASLEPLYTSTVDLSLNIDMVRRLGASTLQTLANQLEEAWGTNLGINVGASQHVVCVVQVGTRSMLCVHVTVQRVVW